MHDGGIIDFHLHLPWRYRDPREAAARLVAEMDSAGVELGVVIAIEASLKRFREYASPPRVRRALSEALDYLIFTRLPRLEKILLEAGAGEGLDEHERLIIEHMRTSREVLAAAESVPGRLLPVASYNPDLGPAGVIRVLEEGEYIGVKLYPTLHFCRPTTRRLEPLYDYMEERGLVLIVHTGCDPGIWELPLMCQHARPKEAAQVARRHPGLTVVIAHMGAYSALNPGIFFEEAVEALSRYDNVYADTSAVDPFYIELAVKRVGDDRILFGSDYPYVTGLTISDAVSAIASLDIPGRSKRRILRENAERLLSSLGFWTPSQGARHHGDRRSQ